MNKAEAKVVIDGILEHLKYLKIQIISDEINESSRMEDIYWCNLRVKLLSCNERVKIMVTVWNSCVQILWEKNYNNEFRAYEYNDPKMFDKITTNIRFIFRQKLREYRDEQIDMMKRCQRGIDFCNEIDKQLRKRGE